MKEVFARVEAKREKESDREGWALIKERLGIVHQLDDWLETPLLILGFVWLVLLVLELSRGLTRGQEAIVTTIWIIFVADFLLKLALAPGKLRYLRKNWLTAIALVIPALRVFRIVRAIRVLRAVRVARGVRLVRIVTSINRGMRALGATMAQRGFGYVLALTVIITIAGGAGMYAFEKEAGAERGISSFGGALWWTAMMMTTMGSEYWPRTPEGRLLCLLLALYAFTVFGYVTAVLATFFIGREQPKRGQEEEMARLQREVARLAALIEAGAAGGGTRAAAAEGTKPGG